jgi:hypothetical protein
MLKNTAFPPFFNGDGSDSRVVINVPTTLTSTKFYDSLVVKASSPLTAGGYRIFSKGLVKVSRFGSIIADGQAPASIDMGGIGAGGVGAATNELGGGGDGGAHTGDSVLHPGENSPTVASLGGDGGSGGGGNEGQARWILGNRATKTHYFDPMYSGFIKSLLFTSEWTTVSSIISGGAGGGCGDGGHEGLPGGGGGGVVWIAADTIWLASGSLISAKGGAGGGGYSSGPNTDGGGGGGGGGILLFCNTIINDGGSLDVSGGTGGAGYGAGTNGLDGGPGIIVVFTPQGIQISTSGTLSP